ncbi:restriction endonuclease subunit S [Streptomyces sp. NPDC059396]|uniref:restriction endonuclease subunit S n=1 Tax=Streptomyces sp. NPDC059396 TaxID=3346819 RepID=UPI0036B3F47E
MRGEDVLSESSAGEGRTQLGSLLVGIKTGWSPACEAYPPAADEWGVVRVSSVTSGRFNPNESKRLPGGLLPRPELEIRAGDVLLARANGARALVGTACYVEATRPKLMLSDKILRLIPDESVVDPRFLAVLFSTSDVRRQIGNLLNGGTGQNNISQVDVRALIVPVIPLAIQHRIVAANAAFERRIAVMEGVIRKLRVAEEAIVSASIMNAENFE